MKNKENNSFTESQKKLAILKNIMKNMENKEFKNRVFGAVIVKAINSNYNADFTGQPRTLPNGTVYATDKAFKFTVRNYLKDIYHENIFFFQTMKEDTGNPMSLDDRYNSLFEETKDNKDKKIVSKNLLSCIDIRVFGATYANKTKKVAVSIHGPAQINHGINIWQENNIFTEQIKAPFSDQKEKTGNQDEVDEAAMTTIGRQSKLEEGHYLHHFSVNPKNLNEVVMLVGEDTIKLSEEDINKLKEAMRRGASYYDSSSKAGTENEFMIWVQLKESSKLVLPNFSQLMKMEKEKQDDKVVLDLNDLSEKLQKHKGDIDKVEIYRNDASIIIKNQPESAKIFSL